MAVMYEDMSRALCILKELLISSEGSSVEPNILRPLENTYATLNSPLFQSLVHISNKYNILESGHLKKNENCSESSLKSHDLSSKSHDLSSKSHDLSLVLHNPSVVSHDHTLLSHDFPSSDNEELNMALLTKATAESSREVTFTKTSHSVGIKITGLSRSGLYIGDLIEGGVASGCGLLQIGDRILSINGNSCDTMASFEAHHILEEVRVGEMVKLSLRYDPTGLMDYLKDNKR